MKNICAHSENRKPGLDKAEFERGVILGACDKTTTKMYRLKSYTVSRLSTEPKDLLKKF